MVRRYVARSAEKRELSISELCMREVTYLGARADSIPHMHMLVASFRCKHIDAFSRLLILRFIEQTHIFNLRV